MIAAYETLLTCVDAILTQRIGRLTEQEFVNMLDAAGVSYGAIHFAAPAYSFAPLTMPRHELKFSLIGKHKQRHCTATFNWADTLYDFSVSDVQ